MRCFFGREATVFALFRPVEQLEHSLGAIHIGKIERALGGPHYNLGKGPIFLLPK